MAWKTDADVHYVNNNTYRVYFQKTLPQRLVNDMAYDD